MPKKVLVVEDELVLRDALTAALTVAGYEVDTAVNGVEGTKKIFSWHPDLILLDLVMPQKNGWEVLQEIKEDKITKKIPVIILTAVGEDKSVSDCVKLGISGYFIKTDYSLEEVVGKINKILA